MTIMHIEGFEGHQPATISSSDNLRFAFNMLAPDVETAWYEGAGASLAIDDADARIAGGQSLKMTRPAGDTDDFINKHAGTLGYGFSAKSDVSVGFGVKYSEAPTQSIPLIQLRYETGTGAEEQLCMWLTPTGGIFFGDEAFNADQEAQLEPNPIPELSSPPAVVRFGYWHYFELFVDLDPSTGDPTLTVVVNNQPVIDSATSVNLHKSTFKYMTSVHLINPGNVYWDDAAFSQWFDDFYLATDIDGTLGPQSIIYVARDDTLEHNWNGSGSAELADDIKINPNDFTSSGIVASAQNQREVWSLADISAGLGELTAFACMVMAGNDGSGGQILDNIEFGVQRSAADTASNHREVTVNDEPRVYYHVTESLGGGDELNRANLNDACFYAISRGVY